MCVCVCVKYFLEHSLPDKKNDNFPGKNILKEKNYFKFLCEITGYEVLIRKVRQVYLLLLSFL